MKTLMNDPAIAEQIGKLDRYIDGDESAEMVEFIKNKLFDALSARFDSKDMLSSYIYEDSDPLGRIETTSIEDGDSLYESVRDIQIDILSNYE